MNNRNRILAVLAAAALAGCASPGDHVIFVTKTSLSLVDVDGTPPSVSFAYDRVEGYLGPRFENGSVPPVIAKISSNGNLLGRDIKQYYATGTAANKLAGDECNETSEDNLEGNSAPMFFGTATTLGIKIGFTASTPDFILGYRRKEMSVIPIGTTDPNGAKTHHYPSVIGVFSNDVQAKTRDNSSLGLTQFFATGTAANALVDNAEGLKASFQGFAKDAVGALKENIRVQQETVLDILQCFADVPDAKIMVVADAAKRLDLFPYASDYDEMKAAAAKDPQKARSIYVASLSHINADAPDRQGKLEGHFAHVCSLRP
jgi:hypothetical protein